MSETFLYLTTIGRISSNPHTIEIWYVEHQDCYYLCAEHGRESDWVKNIEQQSAVQFRIMPRGQEIAWQAGQGAIVTDSDTIDTLKALFDEKYNWSDGLFVRICAAPPVDGTS